MDRLRRLAEFGKSSMSEMHKLRAEAHDDILAFDVSDEVLERAANAEQNAFTLVYCTNPWYNCGLPQ